MKNNPNPSSYPHNHADKKKRQQEKHHRKLGN